MSIQNLIFLKINVIIILQLLFSSYFRFRCMFLQVELRIRFFNLPYIRGKRICMKSYIFDAVRLFTVNNADVSKL